VEFRPMDIQLTDFENAALTVFTGLMVNVINEFALDFILPISKVDEGMLACHD
jgi:glutamate--cysteine ligase catalytic subunit